MPQFGDASTDSLPHRASDVSAIEREQRNQVEKEQEQVQRCDQAEELGHLPRLGQVGGRDLAADSGDSDYADGTVRIALV